MEACKRILLLWALLLTLPVAWAEHDAAEAQAGEFSQAEIDQMLAPIALYPDQLLSQILMAATYPLEIVEAARWARAHPQLQGQDAVAAATEEDWDPSVKSLLAFPNILTMMDEKLQWTEDLGDAFLAQQADVMDRVQVLRRKAADTGNLRSGEHIHVVEEGPTIIVRSAYPDVIYVPYYDPMVVYGNWWWPRYRPVYWAPWPDYGHHHHSGFSWSIGIGVGSGFFFGDWAWGERYVRVVERPPFYYRHAPPPRRIWVHEYEHRRGVRYRTRDLEQHYRSQPSSNRREEWRGDDRRERSEPTRTRMLRNPSTDTAVEPPEPRQLQPDQSRQDRIIRTRSRSSEAPVVPAETESARGGSRYPDTPTEPERESRRSTVPQYRERQSREQQRSTAPASRAAISNPSSQQQEERGDARPRAQAAPRSERRGRSQDSDEQAQQQRFSGTRERSAAREHNSRRTEESRNGRDRREQHGVWR